MPLAWKLRGEEKKEPCPPHEWGEPDEEWQAWHPQIAYVLICKKCKDWWPSRDVLFARPD